MGLYGKHWFINVKLMTFAFAGQIFQFVARQNDTFENLVLGPMLALCQSIIWAGVFLGPKCASGRSMLGAKVSVGSK